MNIISVNNISFRYQKDNIFENATLLLQKGTLGGVLGPNGSGKTTLFDMLCGLRHPAEGNIFNQAVQPLYLSQILSPPSSLQMADIHSLIGNLTTVTPPCGEQTFEKLKQWSPTISRRYAALWKKKPATCSYGEIRAFFALTLLTLPCDLLILDEPTAGIDPEFRHYIWLCLHQACSEGATVLVSSHHIEEITSHCDQFHLIHKRRFLPFNDAEGFMDYFNATSLDEAFINGAIQ
ncbi:MAG: ATP-binding cassette domain-containing protein [Pseudomonas sp.]